MYLITYSVCFGFLFVQRFNTKLGEESWVYTSDRLLAPSMSTLRESSFNMTRRGMKILKLEAWNFSSPPRQRFNFLGAPHPPFLLGLKYTNFRSSLLISSTPPPFHIKWTFPNDRCFERFSFECRKVIGFAFATPHDWLKNLASIFHPIRSKTKTTALSQLPVITSSFDWFTVLCVFFEIE